ncbi:MAG: DUF885 domain-containing protein, partial [Oceanococcaceae bacterium]
KVPQQFLDLAPENADESPLLQSLQRLPDTMDADERAAFTTAVRGLYASQLRPALLGLQVYMQQTYIPGAVRATGLSNLPNGADWYAYEARRFTTTAHTPQEIHDIGKAEVARISDALRDVMAEVGFRGSIRQFVAKTRQDPRWYYTDPEALLKDYRALAMVVSARLPRLFQRFAALPYGIEAIPAFRARGSSAAYYLPGSAEFGRPGVFYVNTTRLDESPKYEMEALLLHEGAPGHHFQIARAQELDDVPAFRKHGRFTAYTEGWGLYAESLGPELGLYADPYSRFGALTFEMWRAVRLVADTGMHALGWSRDQAIEYFEETTGRPRGRIEAEVDRYLVMPGQALAYKMGEILIRDLRAQAEQALGTGFDVRAFHEVVLNAGAMPLAVLEERVNTWISQQEAAS